MTDPATQDLAATLRAHGLSPSAPRLAILRWLLDHPEHPTIDEIYRALHPTMRSLSRTTVYNVLHAFVGHGLAAKVRTEDLELRYDGCAAPHAHFKCTRCGACIRACRYAAWDRKRLECGRPGPSCVLCRDCLTSCPHKALTITLAGTSLGGRAEQIFVCLAAALHAAFLFLAMV